MKVNNSISLKMGELFGADLRSLALFRILISVLIIGDLIFRLGDLDAFYSDSGVLPRYAHIEQFGSWFFCLHLMSGYAIVQAGLFLLSISFAVMLLLGYRTKAVTIILWILISSLHARNSMILTGGDTLLHLMFFWSMFLPLGAYWSMDSVKNHEKEKLPGRVLSFGTVAIFLQLVFVYLFTAINKISPEWLNGSAIYYALNIDQYVTPFGTHLLGFPHLMKFLTHLIFYFEFIGPILLFMPFFTGPIRTLTIFAFFGLQIGFGLCLGVGIFPLSMSIAMIPFLPSWFWEKVLNKSIAPKINLKTSLLSNTLAMIALVIVFIFNLHSVEKLKFKMPQCLERVGYFFSLDQRWYMFGPQTLNDDYWYIFQGNLKNGKRIDLFKNGKKVTWYKPKSSYSLYKNHRWRSYIRGLWASDVRLFSYYGQYLCNTWNKNHKREDEKLTEIEFWYAQEKTLPDYKISKPDIGLTYRYRCY